MVKLVAMTEEYKNKATEMMNEPEVRRNFIRNSIYPLMSEDRDRVFSVKTALKPDYCFGIEIAEGEFIGVCGTELMSLKNRAGNIWIMLGKGYHRKGYGYNALNKLINMMFNEMNLNKVGLEVFSFNEAAIKCYKKLGFKVEGRLRQELFREGKYHDVIMMGLLREEWGNNYGNKKKTHWPFLYVLCTI